MRFPALLLLLLFLLPALSLASHHVKYTHAASDGACEIVSESAEVAHRLADNTGGVHAYRGPLVHHSPLDAEPAHEAHDEIVELYGSGAAMVEAAVAADCTSVSRGAAAKSAKADTTELKEYISSGPSSNRIDVVFMGDGYMASESAKFFSDLARLTDDMFNGVTLSSWLPLFNIWHLFVESNESGVGVNSKALDTRYELFRTGTQLRGITPTSSGTRNLRADCKLAPGCDFPSVISNDNYYGKLTERSAEVAGSIAHTVD